MDHDENTSKLSYYIWGMMIPTGADALLSPPAWPCTFAMITLPKSTNEKDTKRHKISNSRRYEIHQRTTDFDPERVIPWVEDIWTTIDEHEAATILQERTEQCRITDQDYKTKKFRVNDTTAWNQFYQSHQSNFFKDRHYFVKEFPQEFTMSFGEDNDMTCFNNTHFNTTSGIMVPLGGTAPMITNIQRRCLVEIGCGVGNAMLPLLGSDRCSNDDQVSNDMHVRQSIQWTVYGFDLSSAAIDILRRDIRYQQALQLNRTYCDVCDISIPNALPSYVQNVAHVTSLIFCLSAIHPTKHSIVIQNVVSTLQPGKGILIFRDYGRYDLAQIKLGTQRAKLLDTDNFYRKHDGTKCYYFTIEDLEQLVQQQCGALEVLELRYIRRKYTNRSMQCERRRVWVQGRFRRTKQGSDFNESKKCNK